MPIDPAAVHELFTDETDLVGTWLHELRERGEGLARGMTAHATGRLLSTLTSGVDHDHSGTLQAWWGSGYNADVPKGRTYRAGFPIENAMEAEALFVWNRSPRGFPHTSGTRRTHPALTASLFIMSVEGV